MALTYEKVDGKLRVTIELSAPAPVIRDYTLEEIDNMLLTAQGNLANVKNSWQADYEAKTAVVAEITALREQAVAAGVVAIPPEPPPEG